MVMPARREILVSAIALGAIMMAMTAIHILNILLSGALASYGVRPRHLDGLVTIVTAPWIHADWTHLGNNLAAFAVLSVLTLLDGLRRYIAASAIIILLSGLLLWLLGRNALHIGASGWIFGLWAFAIMRAWYDRRPINIAICVLVIFLYGGMTYGLLPTAAGVSFEGHIFGVIAGVAAAWVLRRPMATPPAAPPPPVRFWN